MAAKWMVAFQSLVAAGKLKVESISYERLAFIDGNGTAGSALSLPVVESCLVEAEAFAEKGGWGVDSQFMEQMGSPYLLAHGKYASPSR